jgi:single-stranded-DNA-specific exonuclease
MSTYCWPTDEPNPLSSIDGVSPLTAALLHYRDVGVKEVQDFLAPNYETQLHDPMLLHDMETACVRIEQAIDETQHIAVFADYDCDGIPGAVVAHDFFTAAKHDNLTIYIPHRHYEGFGLSVEAVEKLHAKGAQLIITIDCGVTDVAAVERANELGVDVIITDHHEPGEVLPKALALVNPKLGTYPFTELCGAAVMFKLAQALVSRRDYGLVSGFEKWWLDMVAVATVADMVPLRGENRVLARYGLQVLRKSRRLGLQQLLKKAKADQSQLTEEDIGFTIGPRVNAASRMDTPEEAFLLLTASTAAEASERVTHLEQLNQSRKTAVSLMTKDLHKRMQMLEEIPAVIVMGDPTWRPSLVGLAANKLAEEYGRPAFIWGKDGNDTYKGSCRSGGTASVVTLMRAAADSFIGYGGHHVAGGFAVTDDGIHTFGDALNKAHAELGDAAVIKEDVQIDSELRLEDVNQLLINELKILAPFGAGNRKPLFAFKNVTPVAVEQFGKTKEHLKLVFGTEQGQVEAISFFTTEDSFESKPVVGQTMTLLAHVEQSFFMGRPQIRMMIVDVLP